MRGTIVDAATGAALVDVLVALEVPAAEDAEKPASTEASPWIPTGRSATTDAAGSFTLVAPTSGRVRVVAGSDGYVADAAEAVAPTEGLKLALRAGRPLEVEVVREGTGAPVAGASVAERPRDGLEFSVDILARRTDDAGRVRVVVSRDRRAQLIVTHPSSFPLTVAVPAADGEPLRVALRAAFRAYVDVTTSDGRTPRGLTGWATLYGAEGTGPGRGDAPRPLEPARAGPVEDRALSRGATSLLRFEAHGGAAALNVAARGYALRATERFEVPREGGAARVAVVLDRDPGAGTLAVALVDASGTRVVADDAFPAQLRRTDGGVLVPTEAAVESGALVFDGLAPGRYRVTVAARDHGPAVADVEVAAGPETRVEARFVEEARLHVRLAEPPQRKANVRVTVDGFPVWVSVVDDPAGRARPTQVSVSGVMSWVFLVGGEGVTLGALPPGRATVEVVSPDLVASPATADLAPGRTESVELKARLR